jgi:hypothetical protein
MKDPRAGKRRLSRRRQSLGDPRFEVFGLWLVVRMGAAELAPYAVQCPNGQPIQYGVVVTRGDGFDAEAGDYRDVPEVGSIVAFEETPEGIEGHYFFVGDEEYRIIHLDAINISFPPRSSPPEPSPPAPETNP